MNLANFTEVDRNGSRVWLHCDNTVWVVKYDCQDKRDNFYQAYVAVNNVPKGRDPWTIDNRRIGPEKRGFKTLKEAINAATEKVSG